MKKISLLCIMLALLSCKTVVSVRLPEVKNTNCASELDRAGIALAEKDSNSNCIVVSCDPGYDLYDLKSYVDSIENCSECQNSPMNQLLDLANKYPKICVQHQKDCSSYNVTDGENIWDANHTIFGLTMTVSSQSLAQSVQVSDDPLSFGYTPCMPKEQTSCSEGYTYYAPQGDSGPRMCLYSQYDCTNSIFGAASAVMTFNAELGQYSDCTLISCMPGFSSSENACTPIFCAPGFRLVGDSCVPITCPPGFMLMGNACVFMP